ncbi:MAG: endolytic transglycosylase MltG, partial [Bacteroidia bacterium]|nr:endolytic transglycosylase MltG [Bacteroidia bacterium]
EWVQENGFTSENVWCIFLPDHYHFNWATPADKAITRFVDEYNKFWTEERKNKAKALNLTTKQACILASIVDGEAIHVSEMPTIAGLYLNRMSKGILLQADPTVLYVVGREGRRRVLNRDLKKEDPYNTYLNTGLPPGPIFLPDKRAIEASINPKKHDYIFMCAKPDGSFKHNFTASSAQHLRNAAAYRRSLNRQGIMR